MARKTRERRDALRETLTDIAEVRMRDSGLAALRARDLAKEAGCAVGAIYNVFDDMTGLILAVNGRTFHSLGKTVSSRVDAVADAPPVDGTVGLTLFRPGEPNEQVVGAVVPRLCDSDGLCEPGEQVCNCPVDCGEPSPFELLCGDGIDDDCDRLSDCFDADCCADAACTFSDGDGDLQLECEDCNDADGSVWAVPGETRALALSREPSGTVELTWSPPLEPGGQVTRMRCWPCRGKLAT